MNKIFTLSNFSFDKRAVAWSGKPWSSVKKEINLKCPNLLKSETRSCPTHKIQYTSELHKLPSGRERWSKCPKCPTILDVVSKNMVTKYLTECREKFNQQATQPDVKKIYGSGYIEK